MGQRNGSCSFSTCMTGTWIWGPLTAAAGVLAASMAAQPPAPDPAPGRYAVVGTAGDEVAEAEDSPATIHDVETITGTLDPHVLIGQPVDFHVKVGGVAEDRSFWIGTRDNRLIVVPRSTAPTVTAGDPVRVTGRIERLQPERRDQKVFIDADAVTLR
jgi:hypothetical protein